MTLLVSAGLSQAQMASTKSEKAYLQKVQEGPSAEAAVGTMTQPGASTYRKLGKSLLSWPGRRVGTEVLGGAFQNPAEITARSVADLLKVWL